jgi:hypothetical protein
LCVCGVTGVWTQDFVLAGQVLYTWDMPPQSPEYYFNRSFLTSEKR